MGCYARSEVVGIEYEGSVVHTSEARSEVVGIDMKVVWFINLKLEVRW